MSLLSSHDRAAWLSWTATGTRLGGSTSQQ